MSLDAVSMLTGWQDSSPSDGLSNKILRASRDIAAGKRPSEIGISEVDYTAIAATARKHLKAGHYNEAISTALGVINAQQDNPDTDAYMLARVTAGEAALRKGQPGIAQARGFLEEAVNDSVNPKAAFLLGQAYMQEGQTVPEHWSEQPVYRYKIQRVDNTGLPFQGHDPITLMASAIKDLRVEDFDYSEDNTAFVLFGRTTTPYRLFGSKAQSKREILAFTEFLGGQASEYKTGSKFKRTRANVQMDIQPFSSVGDTHLVGQIEAYNRAHPANQAPLHKVTKEIVNDAEVIPEELVPIDLDEALNLFEIAKGSVGEGNRSMGKEYSLARGNCLILKYQKVHEVALLNKSIESLEEARRLSDPTDNKANSSLLFAYVSRAAEAQGFRRVAQDANGNNRLSNDAPAEDQQRTQNAILVGQATVELDNETELPGTTLRYDRKRVLEKAATIGMGPYITALEKVDNRSQDQNEQLEVYRNIVHLFQERDYQGSLAKCKEVIDSQSNPENINEIKHYAALNKIVLKQYGEAITQLTELIETNNIDSELKSRALYDKGIAHLKKGELREAYKSLQDATKTFENATAYRMLGELNSRQMRQRK